MASNVGTLRSFLSNPLSFFILTFAWSWSFWTLAILLHLSADNVVAIILQALAGIGPMVAGVALIYLTKDSSGRRDFWSRLFDFRRITAKWYLVIFLIVPVLIALAKFLEYLTTGTFPEIGFPQEYLGQPWMLLPFAIFILIFGPIPEEIGRFGYAIDVLQSKYGALNSSILMGTAWALWHLPLFFIDGTYQYGIGFGSVGFWLYMIAMVPGNIVMTWIYNNNKRSVLSAILVHFMMNFMGEITYLSGLAEIYMVGLWVAAAILVCMIYGTKTMALDMSGKVNPENENRTSY